MSDQERLITLTAYYYTAAVGSTPDEAIRSVFGNSATLGAPPAPIIFASAPGGFEAYEANTPVGQIASEGGFIVHAMVPMELNSESPQEPADALKEQFFEKKKGTEKVIFESQDFEQG